ncbi:hypothetical protein TWF173_006295 [Orbilia oligospora]|nr:hypothetical protein TWF173_006295 [Orbilia oligospora]
MSSNSRSESRSDVVVLDGEENEAPCCVGDVTPDSFVSHFQSTAKRAGQGDTEFYRYNYLPYIHRRGLCGRLALGDNYYDDMPDPYKSYSEDDDIDDDIDDNIDVLAALEAQAEQTFWAEKRLVQQTDHISGILNQFALEFESSHNRRHRPKSTDLSAPRQLRTKHDLIALENALASNSSAQLRGRSRDIRNPFRQKSYYSSGGSRSSSRSRFSHFSIDLRDDVNSIDTNASDDDPPLLCVPQCIAAGIPFYRQIFKGIVTSRISELQAKCDRYLRDFEGDFKGSRVIQLGEFASRFRCPFAVRETRNISLCLIVNAENLDGIKNHIKTYHPDVSTTVLSCTSWDQIYNTCVPEAKGKPNPLPSPYFDLQLVREIYKQFWSSDLDLIRTNRSHEEDECFSGCNPPRADLDEKSGSLPEPVATDCCKADSQDFLEIFSSFQAILHIWLSLHLEGGYESPFSASSQGPWRVKSPGSGSNHHPNSASGNRVAVLQTGSVGQGGPRRGVSEGSDGEYEKGSGDRRSGDKTKDRVYSEEKGTLGCPLGQIGLHEFPCRAANGPGRKYGGAKMLRYLRAHIKDKHRNVWAQKRLDSIAHPHTTTWSQIFLTLFPTWPVSNLPIPPKYVSSGTLYRKLEGSPDFELTKEKLYLAVQRDTLDCWTRTGQAESYVDTCLLVQNWNNDHGMAPGFNSPSISFDSGFMGEMVHDMRNPMPEIVSGPRGDHPGPDLHDHSFQNHHAEPDQVDTRGQYFIHRPQTYSSHSAQRNFETPSYRLNYLASAQAPPSQQMPLQISHTNQPLEYLEPLYVSGHPLSLDSQYASVVDVRFQNHFTSGRANEFFSNIFDPNNFLRSPDGIQGFLTTAQSTPPNCQHPQPPRRNWQH